MDTRLLEQRYCRLGMKHVMRNIGSITRAWQHCTREYTQMLRSKIKVPILAGPRRPNPPKRKPAKQSRAWRTQADKFATYLLTSVNNTV